MNEMQRSFTTDHIRSVCDSLLRDRYAEMPIDRLFLGSRMRVIFKGMRHLTESERLHKYFPWKVFRADAYGSAYTQEVGLTHREDRGEDKYVFQYASGHSYSAVPSCKNFLDALEDLNDHAFRVSVRIAEHLDARGICSQQGSFAERIRLGTCITRVLRYCTNEEGKSDAYPHADRGIFSIHWGASHEGLWVFRPNGSRTRIRELEADTIAVFTGRKFAAALRDRTAVCPHGVGFMSTDGGDRYSVVTFVHPGAAASDVRWLLDNDDAMKDFERTLAL